MLPRNLERVNAGEVARRGGLLNVEAYCDPLRALFDRAVAEPTTVWIRF
ncbi:MAG TPA: hypothetical protein VKX49_25590 [Bryobacteraceae bacterium]|nr:hypothetical protein [Bryobacteraceae bacterium]